MQIKQITRPVITLAGIGTVMTTANAQTFDEVMTKYDKDVETYNKAKAEYDKALDDYNQAQTQYQQDVRKYENDKHLYEEAIANHQKDVANYEANKANQDKMRQEYNTKMSQYHKLKAEWDTKKAEYDARKSDYDTTMIKYNKALANYQKQLQERVDTIKRNQQLDADENNKRKEAYDAALKQHEVESRKPGRFSSDVKNALVFTHEPNATVNIDIGTGGGALALVKTIDTNWKFDWAWYWRYLSSDKLDDETLKKHDLNTRVFKHWDSSITSSEYAGGTGDNTNVLAYNILAKKNTPFKVTYTNLQNSTYDGHKISKIEYIYEVLETGSDSDLMQVSVAKDPTMSVWVRGDNGSPNHLTRVKLTPIFYDHNGNKIIPTAEKPIFLGMGSMNAHYKTLDSREEWFYDGKDLFSELMGFPYDRSLYVQNKFYEKYGVKWEERNKDGFYDKVKDEWQPIEKQHWDSWDNVIAPFNKKFTEYMAAKYGEDWKYWPSQYREIVYKLNNGTFVHLNDSQVSSHPDGYYADKNIDVIGDWDDPTSQKQYIGAGVIYVTQDNFSLEFGSTTPKQQKFALNTIVADYYITTKPELELQKTPEPPLPAPPEKPNIVAPSDPGEPPPTPPKFEEHSLEAPVYNGPNKPEPPHEPELVKPVPPKPVTPPEGAVPNDPPKVEIPEFDGGVPPLDPPKVEIPEFNGGVIPLDPPKVEIPEFNGGVIPLDPPTVEIPEFNGGVIPLDPPTVEIPRITPPDPVDNTVMKKIKTSYVDETGKPLRPNKDGKQPKEDIPGYECVKTTKDEDGNTTHIYKKKVKTSYVDTQGRHLLMDEDGERPKRNIPGYDFVKTTKDENGNTIHIYKKKVHTSYVDEKGNPLRPRENNEYEYVKTTKDDDGNTIHIYKVKPKQLPKTGDASFTWFGTAFSFLGLFGIRQKHKKRP